jgi:hypothetical protein
MHCTRMAHRAHRVAAPPTRNAAASSEQGASATRRRLVRLPLCFASSLVSSFYSGMQVHLRWQGSTRWWPRRDKGARPAAGQVLESLAACHVRATGTRGSRGD